MINLQETKTFIEKLAVKAGKILLQEWPKVKISRQKALGDFATNLDEKVEKIIMDSILNKFPRHAILSEEMGEKRTDKTDYTWIIDPLDGTKDYFWKLPNFSVSIALAYKQKIILGIVYFPLTNELFSASQGQGSFLNRKKIKVSSKTCLAKTRLHVELPTINLSKKLQKDYPKILNALLYQTFRLRAYGCATAAICFTAAGKFDGLVDFSGTTKLHDIAAGKLILKEAGGKFEVLKNGIMVGGNKIVFTKLKQVIYDSGFMNHKS